ncbi:hypothetical protein HYV69_01555 [Candidatus Uhrbacteria bacterium]|nr:hypothetical protein [Candidatus Uhrbacteria bacterium]
MVGFNLGFEPREEKMPTYLDAVFAFFGDDEPTDELRNILISRIEPTDEELEEILSSNYVSDEGKAYCIRVQNALLQYCIDSDAYVAELKDEDPRKLGLAEIAENHKQKAAVPAEPIDVVQPAVEPVADTATVSVQSGASRMLSGPVQVAQPPRTTPILPATPAGVQSKQPASQPQGDEMSRRNDTGRERRDVQKSSGDRDDGQQGRQRLNPTQLVEFFDDPDAYIAKMTEDSIERNGLTELIAAIKVRKIAALGNPITREMRECVKTRQWKGIYTALLDAYLREDASRISMAAQLRDSYLGGVYEAKGRIIGALLRQCIKDIEAGLNSSHPNEFKRRYVG